MMADSITKIVFNGRDNDLQIGCRGPLRFFHVIRANTKKYNMKDEK